MEWRPNADNDRFALAILAGFLVARLAFAFSLGLGIDESYTIALSRRLALSYFDHPPLHLWIAHFTALAVGENVVARAPFVALFFATGWIAYRLTSGLFDSQAALIALFALNVTPFFFASAGSWIVPDGPLLFGLVLAAFAAARLFFAELDDDASAWRLWLVAGAALGLAGLSKYSAVLSACGLAAFVIVSPNQRHWLKHPAPYAAAIVAVAMTTPVVLWNARHGWASFEFQAGRGAPEGGLRPAQLASMVLGQIGFLSPWIFAPLVAGLASAIRQRADERHLFLLCLSLPPIAFFTVTPLWGGRGQPHWTMPGWFFAFPLMGVWLEQFGLSAKGLRRSAFVSSLLLAAIAVVAILEAATGWPWAAFTAGSRIADPMLETFAWSDLRKAPIFDPTPSFVVATKWSDAGKIALALGPRTPVFVLSADPRGWAFLDESASFVGRNGVIVTPAADLNAALGAAEPYFADLGQPQFQTLERDGAAAVELALIPASGLTRSLPMPYPGATGR
ncbi:MAG TPA: glycosyltransferase family 39 protein [Roseiarcus sp.]|nr:glycosyltransferase family 39 protein [Roseiarcus sp.]